MKRFLFIVGALLFAMLGATILSSVTGTTSDAHPDFTESGSATVGPVVEQGDGWVLEQVGQCGFRLRIGTKVGQCIDGPFAVGSASLSTAQGAGHRFAVVMYEASTPPRARVFSSSPSVGREVHMHLRSDNVYIGVADLGRATFYGVQILAQDGSLLVVM